ncbi:MAG: DegV family protein [Clostridiales bacterium]|jgi:DegV family protein with EDD domain|nr:DegV family protein [Clostridiales bacterium]
MSNYVVTCSSTVDMPLEFFEKRHVNFACFTFTIDNVTYDDDMGKSMPLDEFYNRIRNGAMPTTSQINVGQFIEFFTPFLEKGLDIVHVTLSSGISGVFNSATIAVNELREKYPERKIYLSNSLSASSGYGLLIDMALDLRDGGANASEVYDWIELNKLKINHWFFTTDLTHLRRGGRISAPAAFFGSMLNICPVLTVDKEGKLAPVSKVRGKAYAMAEVLKKMETNAADGYNYNGKCFISHSSCYEDARKLADLIDDKFPFIKGRVQIYNIGTVIGSHTGPGTVALFFYGNENR